MVIDGDLYPLSLFIPFSAHFPSSQLEGVNVTKWRTMSRLHFTSPDVTFLALEAPSNWFRARDVHHDENKCFLYRILFLTVDVATQHTTSHCCWDMPIGITFLTAQHSQTDLSLHPWILMTILSDLITCAKPPSVALIHILQRPTWSRSNWPNPLLGVWYNLVIDQAFFLFFPEVNKNMILTQAQVFPPSFLCSGL